MRYLKSDELEEIQNTIFYNFKSLLARYYKNKETNENKTTSQARDDLLTELAKRGYNINNSTLYKIENKNILLSAPVIQIFSEVLEVNPSLFYNKRIYKLSAEELEKEIKSPSNDLYLGASTNINLSFYNSLKFPEYKLMYIIQLLNFIDNLHEKLNTADNDSAKNNQQSTADLLNDYDISRMKKVEYENTLSRILAGEGNDNKLYNLLYYLLIKKYNNENTKNRNAAEIKKSVESDILDIIYSKLSPEEKEMLEKKI